MHVYRLTKRQYAQQLNGQGASLFGGRWNSVGNPVIYTAQHRSLAVLEYRVNNPLPQNDLIMVSLELPENSLEKISPSDLPESWDQYAFESPVARRGDQWLAQGKSLLLQVPSAVVPQEYNILINPRHPMMDLVKILDASLFIVDLRMYRKD